MLNNSQSSINSVSLNSIDLASVNVRSQQTSSSFLCRMCNENADLAKNLEVRDAEIRDLKSEKACKCGELLVCCMVKLLFISLVSPVPPTPTNPERMVDNKTLAALFTCEF